MIKGELIITINDHTGKMRGMIHGSVFKPSNLDGLKAILYDLSWYKSLIFSLLLMTDVQHTFGLFVLKKDFAEFSKLLSGFGKIKLIKINYDKNYVRVTGYISPKIATAIRLAT